MKRSWAKVADVRRLKGRGLSIDDLAEELETYPSVVLRILARGTPSYARVSGLSPQDTKRVLAFARRLKQKSLSA